MAPTNQKNANKPEHVSTTEFNSDGLLASIIAKRAAAAAEEAALLDPIRQAAFDALTVLATIATPAFMAELLATFTPASPAGRATRVSVQCSCGAKSHTSAHPLKSDCSKQPKLKVA